MTKNAKPIIAKKDSEVLRFNSQREAARALKATEGHVSLSIKKKWKCMGYELERA